MGWIQRRQHLTDHQIGVEGVANPLGLIEHLDAHRRQAGGFRLGAVGGADLGVAGDRAEHRKAPLDLERRGEQRVDQIALDHVRRKDKRRRTGTEAMPPGRHRAGDGP